MSHTREEEWKQVRALHLVRDERDREVGAAAKGRAGDAVLAASQLFAAVCLLRGDPAWAAFLSLTFVGGGAQCLHRFWEDRERFFLICGLAASACGAALGCWYLLQDPGTGPSLGRLAAFALLISLLTSLSGLIFVPLLLGAVWLKYKVGHMDGEAWEHYFQSVSTVGLLLRGGVLLLLVTIFMIVDDPAKLGVKPYGYEKAAEIAAAVAAKKEKESRQGGLDLAAARRTPSYWLLWIGLAISSFPGVAFRFYNGAFFRGPIGLDTVTYSNWASVLSVCIAAGMILMGVMADKLGSVKMVVLMHVVSIVGYACAIVLMNNTGSFALLLVTVILCGMNGPLDNATAPYLIPEAFGRKYYDEIIGSYAGAMMIGNVCVPMLLGGIISDGTAASFGLAWKIIIGFGAAAMVILLVGLFKGPYRKQYLALRAAEKQQKALGTAEE